MKMEKTPRLLTLLFLSLTISGTAYAGAKATNEVTIGTTYFSGSIGSARNSADTIQSIGCVDNGATAVCYAQDAAGNMKGCTTSDAAQLAMIRGLSDSSYFSTSFDSNGDCINMKVTNSSMHEPKM